MGQYHHKASQNSCNKSDSKTKYYILSIVLKKSFETVDFDYRKMNA